MVLGGILTAIAPVVIGTGFQARGGPLDVTPRAPRGPTGGELLRTSLEIQALSEQGLVPRLVANPFTGGTVLATEDQLPILFDLLGERFAREELAGTPEQSAAIFAAREAFIEQRRIFPVFPGAVPPPPIAPDPAVMEVRQAVTASLARTSPQAVAPGVVSSAIAAKPRRLGGPCAGLGSLQQRLNCARGGFT